MKDQVDVVVPRDEAVVAVGAQQRSAVHPERYVTGSQRARRRAEHRQQSRALRPRQLSAELPRLVRLPVPVLRPEVQTVADVVRFAIFRPGVDRR